ncbi:glycoprotease pgp1 mitochondrial precursor [Clathrospora elynae]|uniref:N(6)-L-threonylcarbamoyladenine synthase n=1 Tax=Clathrospora elynae TaxID=706981 RepID=A0A6A5SQX1_9PLEO|nr:glycoprotease pgp1 mitochondrial precursor [Clathrospora elynae]
MTLAIETSCDDTSVAVVEKGIQHGRTVGQLHFHKKVTSDNSEYQGVHPLVSLQSHQENLALLITEAIDHLPLQDEHLASRTSNSRVGETMTRRLPDFISVTRGPGMRSNLFTGLDTAKGLAVAWQKPLVGVHHMQAHALTPRMVSALESYNTSDAPAGPSSPNTVFTQDSTVDHTPDFPFMSVLASGGHTLIIHSASLTDHRVLGTTTDIACGECLDKVARVVLPAEVLQSTKSTMYGALLEAFALPDKSQGRHSPGHDASPSAPVSELPVHTAQTYLDTYGPQYNWYRVSTNQEDAMRKSMTKWGWALNRPLTKSSGGTKINSLEMSFSGITTMAERIIRHGMDPDTKKLHRNERAAADISIEERKDLARETMRAAFEHVASRVVLGLQSLHHVTTAKPAVVIAGGVAANLLASTLCAHGYSDVELHFPPPKFCTDNAAMIGWAGLEMFEAGYTDPLSIRAIRKWPLSELLHPPRDG